MPNAVQSAYTTKIIKAGALLPDTKALLAHWDAGRPVEDNLDRLQRDNVFGKGSRARVEEILSAFRQRYLCSPSIISALVTLVQAGFAPEALDRILYYHAAQSDRLLHDTVTELLYPLQARGLTLVTTVEIERALADWVDQGKTTGRWSEPTTLRVAQGLMATLRDFGVLQGAVKKRLAPVYLPIEAFAYLVFYLQQEQPSGALLINHPEWRLFFLPPAGVERFLMEAHQQHLLEYHAAGSVVRIEFPVPSLEEYAHVIAQRPH